jgi:hydrogenase-4 membrane subunit HyfE
MARVVVPYLQTLRESPETKFDRKFVVPAVVSVIIALILSPFVFAALPADQVAAPLTLQGFAVLFVAAGAVFQSMALALKAAVNFSARMAGAGEELAK